MMKAVINELKTRHKEHFESQLATTLLKHPEYFPSVKKMSEKISMLMDKYQSKVTQIIRDTPKIAEELKQPFFGASLATEDQPSAEEIYRLMINTLNDGHRDLSNILQTHCIFIYRIYDRLEQPSHKSDLVKTIFPLSIFNKDFHGRTEKPVAPKSTLAQGITKNAFFSKKVEKHENLHIRALDKFELSKNAQFNEHAMQHNLPTVCGPSGHTGSLMLGAKLYGDLTPDELQEYTLAAFSFLASGGNHSFHEVYMIANLLGVPYEVNNYAANLPKAMIETEALAPLKSHFSMYL